MCRLHTEGHVMFGALTIAHPTFSVNGCKSSLRIARLSPHDTLGDRPYPGDGAAAFHGRPKPCVAPSGLVGPALPVLVLPPVLLRLRSAAGRRRRTAVGLHSARPASPAGLLVLLLELSSVLPQRADVSRGVDQGSPQVALGLATQRKDQVSSWRAAHRSCLSRRGC